MSTDRYWVLLAKKQSGEASPEELQELGEMEADPATAELIDRVWLAPMEAVPETYPNRQVWHRIQKQVYAGESVRSRLVVMGRWAAAAVVVALLGIFAWTLSQRKQPPAVMNQVATQGGSKTRVELPDGTQVWLNANSQLNYAAASFGREERLVTLTGEAYFDVVKNEHAPFIIQTRNITIRVLGTAFTVRAYPKENTVETSLIRGMVSITTRQDPERAIILKPAEKLIVPVEAAAEKVVIRQKKDTAVETIWTRNKLEFDNETLEELAPKLENWYHIAIHFDDAAIRRRRFSGVIEKETIAQTLDAMKLSGRFEYRLKENELWLREN